MDRRALSLLVLVGSAACEGDAFRLVDSTTSSTASSTASTSGGGSGGAGAGHGGAATAGSTASSGAAGPASSSTGAATGGAAGSSGSAGGMGSDVTLVCNGITCAAGQSCCHDGSTPGGDNCGAPGSCGLGEVTCATPADCPANELCCMTESSQTRAPHFAAVVCQATCNGSNDILMCSPEGLCPGGRTCYESSWLGPAYKFCQ